MNMDDVEMDVPEFPAGPLVKPEDLPEPVRSATLGKRRITIRIDADVLAAFREMASARGTAYQSEINRALREYLRDERMAEVVKGAVREAVREVMDKAA